MLKSISYKKDLPIHMAVYNINVLPWHYHDDLQIVYMLNGSIKLKVAQLNVTLQKGSIHIIQCGDVHGFYDGSENNQVLVISLKSEYFSSIFPDFENNIFSTEMADTTETQRKKEALKELIYQMYYDFAVQKKENPEAVSKAALDFVVFLRENFRGYILTDDCLLEHRIEYDKYQEERIRRVVGFLYTNYASKITLAQISELENINPYYLSHLIHKYTGKSFRDLLGIVRVESSESRVLSSKLSISRIGHDVGFSSYAYFVKHFKSFYGCEPTEYRALHKGKIIKIANTEMQDISEEVSEYFESSFANTYSQSENKFTFTIDYNTSVSILSKNPTLDSFTPISYCIDLNLCPVKLHSSTNNLISYKAYDKNLNHIIFLEKFLNSFDTIKNITLIDNQSNKRGLFTYNGLKKPLYYTYEFILKMNPHVLTKGDFHLITSSDQSYSVLLFNPHKKTIEINLLMVNFPNNIRVTEEFLSRNQSCFKYWENLEFNHLSQDTVDLINKNTHSTLSFKTVLKNEVSDYNLHLNSGDLVLLTLELK